MGLDRLRNSFGRALGHPNGFKDIAVTETIVSAALSQAPSIVRSLIKVHETKL
jgi:hypothetical protein